MSNYPPLNLNCDRRYWELYLMNMNAYQEMREERFYPPMICYCAWCGAWVQPWASCPANIHAAAARHEIPQRRNDRRRRRFIPRHHRSLPSGAFFQRINQNTEPMDIVRPQRVSTPIRVPPVKACQRNVQLADGTKTTTFCQTCSSHNN